MTIKKIFNFTPWILAVCFFAYTILSWILVFRDPRAVIGIGNLYPTLKDFLFATEATLAGYGINSLPTIVFAFVSIIAVVFYFASLKMKIPLKKTIIFALIFQVITFLSFPILSTDIFSYIFSERVSTVHGQNIWEVKPAAFPDDQFGVLADWKDTTSVYGGVHYAMYWLPSVIGQNNLLLLVILYKLLPAIFTLGTMYIFYKLLQLNKSESSEKLIRLVFWSPLFILEIFGSGHNDGMMIFFTLLSYYLYRRNLWLLAGIALALAVQIKLIPVVLFFFCLLALIRGRKLQGVFQYFVGFVSVNAISFYLMGINIMDFFQRVVYNGGVYWQSLQNLMQTFYPQASQIVVPAFLLWLCVFIVLQWKKKSDPLQSYVVVLLVYLLFVSAAYWNWYVLWIFPLIPFITEKKVFAMTTVLSITSLFAYPLLWVVLRINTPSPIWPILTYIAIFGTSIGIYFFIQMQQKKSIQFMKTLGLYNLIADKGHN